MSPERESGARPLGGPRRIARIGVLGGASMLLATGAHLSAGGRLPSVGVLLLSGFLVGLVATTLTARRCRFGTLAVALAVEQALLHVVFDATSMAAGCAGGMSGGHGTTASCLADGTTLAGAGLAGAGLAGPGLTGAGLTGAGLTGAGAASSGQDLGMLLAHVAATLATAWLLARGEQQLWALCEAAVAAAGAAPTRRIRRLRPPRPLPAPALRCTGRPTLADPRGPPTYAWSV